MKYILLVALFCVSISMHAEEQAKVDKVFGFSTHSSLDNSILEIRNNHGEVKGAANLKFNLTMIVVSMSKTYFGLKEPKILLYFYNKKLLFIEISMFNGYIASGNSGLRLYEYFNKKYNSNVQFDSINTLWEIDKKIIWTGKDTTVYWRRSEYPQDETVYYRVQNNQINQKFLSEVAVPQNYDPCEIYDGPCSGLYITTDTEKSLDILVDPVGEDPNIKYINARNGLNLRIEPMLVASKIIKIPYNNEVFIYDKSADETINNITAPWYNVMTVIDKQPYMGWVFGGYLRDTRTPK